MQPEVFPPPWRTEGERALGMIWWMVLGLLPALIGALIQSPFVLPRGNAPSASPTALACPTPAPQPGVTPPALTPTPVC